jgi:hypothetical protein
LAFFLQTHDGDVGSTAKQKHVADFFANKWRLRNQKNQAMIVSKYLQERVQ